MIGQAYRHSNDCQCRVGVAGGRKYRATGDKEITRTEHATIRIDHTVPGIIRHASRTHYMSTGWFKLLADIGLNIITMKLNITDFIAAKMAIDKLMGPYNASNVDIVTVEIHHNSPHSKLIQFI